MLCQYCEEKEATVECGNLCNTVYCSSNCAKSDWYSSHKETCSQNFKFAILDAEELEHLSDLALVGKQRVLYPNFRKPNTKGPQPYRTYPSKYPGGPPNVDLDVFYCTLNWL